MTHTTKHTPGPWKAVQHPCEHKWAWTIEGADEVGQIIARMGLVNDAHAVAANAHLIAAAPAMYLELKEGLVLLEASHHDVVYLYGIDSLQAKTVWERIESTRNALAQADGEGILP